MSCKKLKIALIEPVGGHGGMDYYDYGLASGLGQNDCEVWYYTCSKTNLREFKNVHTIFSFNDLWGKRKLIKLAAFLGCYWKTIQHAKKQKIQIAHLHFFGFSPPSLLALFLLKVYRLKVIVTVHDISSFHKKSQNWVEKWSYRLIDGVIVHNQSSLNDLQKKNLDLLPPVVVIPHGNYHPFVKDLPLPEDPESIRLLFFGQIKEVKGLEVLLEAFAQVRKQTDKFKLTIAGRPWKTGQGKYEHLITKLGLKNKIETHFRYIEENEMESFYAQSDVIVLPYKRIYQSGVLLMSMSYGRTVITSDLPAFQEVVENGVNGFTFQSENVEDLAKCILNLDRTKIKNATNRAIEMMDGKFNWINIGKLTSKFYNTI